MIILTYNVGAMDRKRSKKLIYPVRPWEQNGITDLAHHHHD